MNDWLNKAVPEYATYEYVMDIYFKITIIYM